MTDSVRTSLLRLRRLFMIKGTPPRKFRNINFPGIMVNSNTMPQSRPFFNNSRGTWIVVTSGAGLYQDEGKGPRKVRVMKVLLRRISGLRT